MPGIMAYNTRVTHVSALLPPEFYSAATPLVARALLGAVLVRQVDGLRLAGQIIETEAYRGEEDLACHARAGRTRRTAVMYGLPGRAYVYFTYGMHWCLNAVTESEGFPAAVLIRAVRPLEGLEAIALRRPGLDPAHWCDGPAKLCRAFAIDGALNGADLTLPEGGLWIESGPPMPPDAAVETGNRVGIAYAAEPWRSIAWRFRLKFMV
jgi:DNA-3-methyladenine glycosylase